jgi:PAS domain S-box-containing protein
MKLFHCSITSVMRIKPFFFCLTALLLLSLLPRLEANDEPLIFVGDQSYAPIESLQGGRPEGLNIDILQALSKTMGRKISIQLMLWNEAQQKVLNGEAHALTIMSPSDERRKLYDFSDPTLPMHYSIFVKGDNMTIHKVKDLEGKRVGVTKGGFPRKILERNNRIQLVFIEDYREGYRLLLSGTIDAVGADTWVGAYTIQEHGIRGVKIAIEPFTKRASAIAVKKGNVKLLHDINDGIKKLRNDGTIEQLIDKWSSKEVVFLTRERIRMVLLGALIVLFLAITGAILIWNRMLRDQVRVKTAMLRTSEEKYRGIFNTVPTSIVLINKDGQIIDINPHHVNHIGKGQVTKEDFIGKDIVTHPSIVNAGLSETYKRVLEGGPFDQKKVYFPALTGGTEGYFNVRGVPLFKDGEVIGAITTHEDITARKQAEEQIKASLKEKEVLLKEIHHRVKNNLQVIASLLNLQSHHIKDKDSREMFQESQNRVRSMALIHENLYTSEDLAHIDIASYIQDLTASLFSAYTVNNAIKVNTDITDIFLTITTAIPCGLIINELVTNALKHAFPKEQDGTITISMTPSTNDHLILTVSDTGIGFPERIDFRNTTTLGMQLVISLVEQLDGTITMDRRKGTTFTITFRGGGFQYKRRNIGNGTSTDTDC